MAVTLFAGVLGTIVDGQPVAEPEVIPAEVADLNFPANTPLSLLVDYVSDRLGLNIVYDGQLARSQVTLRTPEPVPVSALRPLLESLLATNGFALVGDGEDGVLRVVPQQQMAAAAQLQGEEGQQEVRGAAVVIEVFDLAHADPAQAEASLRPFLSGQGAVLSSDPQRRQLVVTDVASRIEDLAELVERLDQPTPAPAVRYYRVQHVEAGGAAGAVGRAARGDGGGREPAGRRRREPVGAADRRPADEPAGGGGPGGFGGPSGGAWRRSWTPTSSWCRGSTRCRT